MTKLRARTTRRHGRPRRISYALTITLVILWMMLFTAYDPITILSGIAVAVAIQWAFPLPHVTHQWRIRLLPFLRLLGHFLWDVLTSGLRMTVMLIRVGQPQGGFVDVPLTTTDPVHMTTIAALTSLVPGSVVIDAHPTTGIMRLHIFDLPTVGGPDAVIASVHHVEGMLMDALGTHPHSLGTRHNARGQRMRTRNGRTGRKRR